MLQSSETWLWLLYIQDTSSPQSEEEIDREGSILI